MGKTTIPALVARGLAGSEHARLSVGGAPNPADVCIVLSDGRPLAEVTAARIEDACSLRGVPVLRALHRRGELEAVAAEETAR